MCTCIKIRHCQQCRIKFRKWHFPCGRLKIHFDHAMLFVELDLHSVVEFYLGAACISFDLYDLVVGIVVGDVLGDRCRMIPVGTALYLQSMSVHSPLRSNSILSPFLNAIS
mgnify:CR=1 FL=1